MKQKQIEKGVERDNGEKSGDSKVTDEDSVEKLTIPLYGCIV